MRYILVLIFFMGFVFAAEADFNCPGEVSVNSEFECSLELTGIEGEWDVKVDITSEGSNVARIYNPIKDSWGSAYYYLKEFASGGKEKKIKLKIIKEGDYDGILKIRQGSKKEYFDFKISVGDNLREDNREEKDTEEEESDRGEEEIIKDDLENIEDVDTTSEVQDTFDSSEILLNGKPSIIEVDKEEIELIYESKNQKILRYAPYVFAFFLILFIGFLLFDR